MHNLILAIKQYSDDPKIVEELIIIAQAYFKSGMPVEEVKKEFEEMYGITYSAS